MTIKIPSIKAWFLSRIPVQSRLTLNRHTVYILPTQEGIIFAAILLLMLAGAINYNNSLLFISTFFFISIAIYSMYQTQQNLLNIQVSKGNCQPVHAGNNALFPLQLKQTQQDCKYSIALSLQQTTHITDIPFEHSITITLPYPAEKRGYLSLPKVTISSNYPLGLFRAWSYIYLDQSCLVYPAPNKHYAVTHHDLSHTTEGLAGLEAGSDEFATLRTYQLGDNLHHVHWKSVAKQQKMFTKQYYNTQSKQIWINWNSYPNLSIEEKLSAMTAALLYAEQHGLQYGLQLPNKTIMINQGFSHLHACLKVLALY